MSPMTRHANNRNGDIGRYQKCCDGSFAAERVLPGETVAFYWAAKPSLPSRTPSAAKPSLRGKTPVTAKHSIRDFINRSAQSGSKPDQSFLAPKVGHGRRATIGQRRVTSRTVASSHGCSDAGLFRRSLYQAPANG
ncbi:hypothetical protein Bbelb_228590 [Branchiostoma belcheri]|nr:hypothetical protein Bbelb_228590 [Branchiostoma belcheri]